jgi:hypothetical protein
MFSSSEPMIGWTFITASGVFRSAIVRVFEVIGWPLEPSGDPVLIEAFFVELKKHRPDLFKQPKESDRSSSPPSSSKGCLVCILSVALILFAIVAKVLGLKS